MNSLTSRASVWPRTTAQTLVERPRLSVFEATETEYRAVLEDGRYGRRLLSDLLERLFAEFEDRHTFVIIRDIAASCHPGLRGPIGWTLLDGCR